MEVPQGVIDYAENVINTGTDEEILAFFAFYSDEERYITAFKFNYWAFKVYPRYYQSKPAKFHDDFIRHMLDCYYGDYNYVNLGFRGCAKTTFTKLFLAFVILNDASIHRKYLKVLTRNIGNAKQVVTDVYNLIIEASPLYGNIFANESKKKQEETMGSFTTSDGRKLLSGTVGMTQRGHLQDAYRPDFVVFDDVEDRESIQSLTTTESTIWRIDEALTGLSADGSYMVNGNYISDEGVIQWFLNKPNMVVDKIPIRDEDGNPTWPARYPKEKIEELENGGTDDFYGEYMCDPSRADTAFFDRARVDADIAVAKQPHSESAGFKYWGQYIPHHRFAIGADTSEGIGKDANTAALFDFGVHDNDIGTLVATYYNNRIPPDLFGHELMRLGREYGNCLIAPEANNTGHATLATMRGYANIFSQRTEGHRAQRVTDKLGWRTTRKTKPKMLFDFRKDYNDGLIKIYDINVLKEMRGYTTADLTGTQTGMVTRHFDLLMACFVGETMVLTDRGQRPIKDIQVGDLVLTRAGYKKVIANIAHNKPVITKLGLTGTADHPVICNGSEEKELQAVRHGDILTIWNEQTQSIENRVLIEESNIGDTPTLSTATIEFISWEGQQTNGQGSTYIDKFGLTILGRFLKDFVSTIKMVMHSTTRLIISKLLAFLTTCDTIWRSLREKKHYAKQSSKIEKKLTKVSETVSTQDPESSASANGVERILQRLRTTLAFVDAHAPTERKENERKSHISRNNVQFAGEATSPVSRTNDTVGNYASVNAGENIQTVYNLQIEGQPEYFANNILVHNCVIAWQMRKYVTHETFEDDFVEEEPLFAEIGV